MRELIDAIIHIADVPALMGWFVVNDPTHLRFDESGVPVGFVSFDGTPMISDSAAAMTYVRVTVADAGTFRAAPGVTVLSEAPYVGPNTADVVYAALAADDDAMALYDAVYPRAAIEIEDSETGDTFTHSPPFRFGSMK